MSLVILSCRGGTLSLPAEGAALVDRRDGGNLVVNPPHDVWERSELTAEDLKNWSCLVAAAGAAMLAQLPQLTGGCINYWEAGNWALNDLALPTGPKFAPGHRKVHLHLLGRSPTADSPDHRWGEAPRFPEFRDKERWSAGFARLNPVEVKDVVRATIANLMQKYGFALDDIDSSSICAGCDYIISLQDRSANSFCRECNAKAIE